MEELLITLDLFNWEKGIEWGSWDDANGEKIIYTHPKNNDWIAFNERIDGVGVLSIGVVIMDGYKTWEELKEAVAERGH